MMHLYGLKNCSTCKKAINWLDGHAVEYVFTDYREVPLAASDLVRYAQHLGGWEKLVNRASPTWRKLDAAEQAAVSDEQWTSLIARNPTLVRRPLTVYADGSVSTGFNEARFAKKLQGE